MKYEAKKIGLWMLTALMFLLTVYSLANGGILGGILYAILALFISPLRIKIFEKFHFPNLKRLPIIFIAIVLFFAASLSSAAKVDTSVNTINELNNQVTQISLEKDSLYVTIDDLNDKIRTDEERYQSKQAEYETNLTEKDTKMKEQEAQISQLQEQVESFAEYQSQIDALTSENTSLKNDINQLQQQVASSKTSTSTTTDDGTAIASSSSVSNNSVSNDDVTVYITKTGDKYHLSGCRYLKKSKISISKSSAISQGYDACSVCNP